MSTSSTPICIGKIGAAQGLKGHVRIQSWTDPEHQIFDYSPWSLSLNKNETLVSASKVEHGKHIIAKIEGIDDRTAAQALTHAEIFVARDQLPEPQEDEYYFADVIGAKVINHTGETIGILDEITNFGAHDTLVVKQGKKTIYIPNVKQFVLSIDVDNKLVQANWDEDF